MSTAPRDDLTGQTLGDYHCLRRLGRGAMAEVYLAEQRSLGRRVALKVLAADLARDATYVERFQHEARAAAALVHANIVQIYEVGVAGDRHFIAQEYVPGHNGGELIRREGRLEPGLVLDLLRQVAAALGRASDAGIVHRDIKPENLLLAPSGEVKVADFGLARAGQAGNQLTQVGVTMGTPLYMSPEQVEGRPVDARSDLYALGVTAYHMLAGSPPFDGETPLSVAVQHLNREPPPLAERCPDAPAELVRLVEQMMAKAPDERPATPNQLLADLRELASQAARDGWAAGPEHWPLADTLALSQAEAPATKRLGSVMQAASALDASAEEGRPWRRRLAAGIAFFLIGLVVASARPTSLLSTPRQGPAEKDNVRLQIFHAKLVDTEEAWRIIPTRFPDADRLYQLLAEEGLARHYLARSRYADARPLCRRLASLSDDHAAFKRFGMAGSVVCDIALGDVRRAESALGSRELVDSLPELQRSDRAMHEMLEQARQRLRERQSAG